MIAGILLAAVLTTSQQNAHLRNVNDLFLTHVRECGPALLKKYNLSHTPKKLSFAYSPIPNPNRLAVAAVKLNGSEIVLYDRFFDLPADKAWPYLVHEWLHTQGLPEVPHITETVIEVCK